MAPIDDKSSLDQSTDMPVPRAESVSLVPASGHVAPVRKPRRRWWLWGGAGLILVAIAGLLYTQFWMSRPPVVAVEVAALAPATRVLAVNGRIAAEDSVEVRSVVTGNLKSIEVAEGDKVEAGQILAWVDSEAQTAIVRQSAAALDAALVARQRAQEAYDRAVAGGGNVTRVALEAAAHDLETAEQEVARLTAALDQANVVLANYTIRAPVTGSVLTLDAERGQIVGPTIPLLTLADLSDLVVEADVDEAYATQIALNQPAVLQLAGESATRDGHVSFVSTVVNVSTGGLAIKIDFDDPVSAPIGMTVATNIVVEQRAAALTVPRAALRAGAEGQGVFVVTDGKAQLRPVTVVEWPAARLIVTDGLAEGDVVIADATGISDGQAVEPDLP
ncbi:efflux RND transporter periplasmic adaptor subunit [Frigidibacter sp. ROC022]|uniref:efflux RND transporter periplasmic adaptor subunit n=1 Tax=Frigidibacter sp. ROC022 TaxID=2971796 RepID=UPI00215B2985|nr:efflux RND transporter periplasmic adaptor subunit [Frigidibacter sp. ROC022]MCR8726021.1 efflux RND transporter periplasmic adaptor subunit [Frigidibacter sp. ROC022]